MGLNKSKETATPTPSLRKAKSKRLDTLSTSPNSLSGASSSYGSMKTTKNPSQTVHESELASDSKDKRSESRRFLIPQIVITRASTDILRTPSQEQDEQRTIKDKTDYGPYYRHRMPSTVDAYHRTKPEPPKRKAKK